MYNDIEELLSSFKSGDISRRELVRHIATLTLVVGGAGAALITSDANAEDCACPDQIPTSDCTEANPDFLHALVERLVNTRFKLDGNAITICPGQEVWKGTTASTAHEKWLFANPPKPGSEPNDRQGFIALRDDSTKTGSLTMPQGTNANGNYDGTHGGKAVQNGENTRIQSVLKETTTLGVFEERNRLLYRVMKRKIEIEQDSHAWHAIECFAKWLDGDAPPAGDPVHQGELCAAEACDPDNEKSFHDCFMHYKTLCGDTGVRHIEHDWY